MKKPIFYKKVSNGDCFKVQMNDDIPDDQIDACLDAIGVDDTVFITEDEFNQKYESTMEIDIFDTTDTFKIGVLTTEFLDMED